MLVDKSVVKARRINNFKNKIMRLKFRKFKNHIKILWYDRDLVGYKEWTISIKGVKYWGWKPF